MMASKPIDEGKLKLKYRKYFQNDVLLSGAARKGLKSDAVFDFIQLSKMSNAKVEHLLNKTIKTFTSYNANNTHLDATTSEKLLKLFALYDKGAMVFGAAEAFNNWLKEPSIGLGGHAPEELMNTITGIDLVIQEVTRIEYGDLA